MLDLFMGLGPFELDEMTWVSNATLNPHSINKNASILYFDNPAGVGYSYVGRDKDYSQNNIQVGMDAMEVVLKFFADWPELKRNPLYISGHSYGGIYAPYLTWEIHQYNQQ
jgi:carboxypeptidase C (cathepsin A)